MCISPNEEEASHRKAVIDRLTAKYRKALEKELRISGVTYDDIEEMAQKIGEDTKRSIEDESIQSQGCGYEGTRVTCPGCQAIGRYRGRRARHVISLSGFHRIERSYYYCGLCHRGWCPLDRDLDLPISSEATRRVRALSARFSSYLPYRLAAQELSEVCGVELSATALQGYAKVIGEQVEREWARQTHLASERKVRPSCEYPDKLQMSMDGVMIFVDNDWREAKVGAAYPLNADAEAQTKQARYYATLERSSIFGKRMQVLAHQAGSDHCCKLGVVGDGADWIWIESGKYWPRSVQSLDFRHLGEHLWKVAKLRFGEGSAAASEWIEQQEAYLMEDKAESVLASVQSWRPRKPEKIEERRKLIAYMLEHKKRIRYKSIKEAGYQIGSGVIEAANKTVVQARMKGAGMRWSFKGAQVMLHLCAARHSKGFENFIPYAI